MTDISRVRKILRDTLQLGARADRLTEDSRLLGEIPEFDSMAVVAVVTAIEEEYGLTIHDDELSAELFETVGSLSRFISRRTNG
jgi:acyl carrier protein